MLVNADGNNDYQLDVVYSRSYYQDMEIPTQELNEIENRKDHPSTLIFKICHRGKKLYEDNTI